MSMVAAEVEAVEEARVDLALAQAVLVAAEVEERCGVLSERT